MSLVLYFYSLLKMFALAPISLNKPPHHPKPTLFWMGSSQKPAGWAEQQKSFPASLSRWAQLCPLWACKTVGHMMSSCFTHVWNRRHGATQQGSQQHPLGRSVRSLVGRRRQVEWACSTAPTTVPLCGIRACTQPDITVRDKKEKTCLLTTTYWKRSAGS